MILPVSWYHATKPIWVLKAYIDWTLAYLCHMHYISLKYKYVTISSKETFETLSDLSFSNMHTLNLSFVLYHDTKQS